MGRKSLYQIHSNFVLILLTSLVVCIVLSTNCSDLTMITEDLIRNENYSFIFTNSVNNVLDLVTFVIVNYDFMWRAKALRCYDRVVIKLSAHKQYMYLTYPVLLKPFISCTNVWRETNEIKYKLNVNLIKFISLFIERPFTLLFTM